MLLEELSGLRSMIFFLVILWLTSGFVAASVAKAKGWSGSSWFWAGFLLGPAGLLGAVGMPDRLLRKYLRQIAARQDALGDQLHDCQFVASDKSGDEIWRGIIGCAGPALAPFLSRTNSTLWPRKVEIRDDEGFYIGVATAAGEPEDGKITWNVEISR